MSDSIIPLPVLVRILKIIRSLTDQAAILDLDVDVTNVAVAALRSHSPGYLHAVLTGTGLLVLALFLYVCLLTWLSGCAR